MKKEFKIYLVTLINFSNSALMKKTKYRWKMVEKHGEDILGLVKFINIKKYYKKKNYFYQVEN